MALQYRSYRRVEALVLRSEPVDILTEVRISQIANKELRADLELADKRLAEVQSNIAQQSIEDEFKRLELLSGDVAVTGEGIEITIDSVIPAFWLTDLITQLVNGGAEAVSLNAKRVLPDTAGFRDVSDGLLMRSFFLKPPFTIAAIGPRDQMHKSITQGGGIVDRLSLASSNAKIIVAKSDVVIIPAATPK